MRRIWIQVLIFGLAFCVFVTGTAPVFARTERIGVVRMSKLFDDYERTKEFDQKFQTEGRLKQEERDAIVRELQSLRDEQALAAEEARAEKEEQINAKLKELDEFELEVRRSLGKERDGAIREVFQDIENVMQRYGERKGFDLVINERALLYASTKLDVTDEVLVELNNDYKKNKEKS